jgi:hypothetical protein
MLDKHEVPGSNPGWPTIRMTRKPIHRMGFFYAWTYPRNRSIGRRRSPKAVENRGKWCTNWCTFCRHGRGFVARVEMINYGSVEGADTAEFPGRSAAVARARFRSRMRAYKPAPHPSGVLRPYTVAARPATVYDRPGTPGKQTHAIVRCPTDVGWSDSRSPSSSEGDRPPPA